MPRFDGQMFGAQLEEIAASSTTPAARSRIYSDISTAGAAVPTYHDGTGWRRVQINRLVPQTFTTTSTVVITDDMIYGNASSAAFTTNLPDAATCTGKTFTFQRIDSTFANAWTLDGNGGQTIGGSGTYALYTIGETLSILSDGSNWQILNHFIPYLWTAWTPTGSWVANSTYTGFWARRGDSIDLQIQIALAGAPTSASLTITLPWTIATAKLIQSGTGCPFPAAVTLEDTAVDNYSGFIDFSSTTAIAVLRDDGDGTRSAVTQAAPFTFGNGDFVRINVRGIPVSGWNP
jgi:hypothetical protein